MSFLGNGIASWRLEPSHLLARSPDDLHGAMCRVLTPYIKAGFPSCKHNFDVYYFLQIILFDVHSPGSP